MIECQSNYIVSCIRTLIEAEGKSIDCRKDYLEPSKKHNIFHDNLSFFLFQAGVDVKVVELHLC